MGEAIGRASHILVKPLCMKEGGSISDENAA